MSLINLRDRTIDAKIVYYGTALSGKTTSLKHVHRVMDPECRTELVSLNTEGDRTLFFDFLPIPLGSIGGFRVRLQAFTVPGQVKYNLTRRFVLRGADAVIFVADSSPEAFDQNIHSLATLHENLAANGLDATGLPILVQYNKRDARDAVPIERLHAALNSAGWSEYGTVATTGEGVFEAFTDLACAMVEALAREFGFTDVVSARAEIETRLASLTRAHAERPAPTAATQGKENSALAGDDGRAERLAAVIEVTTATEEGPEIEELLASAVETQIEAARLVAELNTTRRDLADRVRQLAALHETGVLIASELDGRRLLERVLDRALQAVGSSYGSILLVDPVDGQLTGDLVRGYSRDPLALDGAAPPELAERVLAGAGFVVRASIEPGLLKSPFLNVAPPTLGLLAPIVHQSEVLGVLAAYLTNDPGSDVLEDLIAFLSAIAAQAAVALTNARLYARIDGFNRELERKVQERTRALRRAYRDLQQVDALKDDFLASMSHELLTPLTSISGFAELLETTAAEDGPDAAGNRHEFATIVREEARRLSDLVQSVLDLSSLEAGRITLRTGKVPVRDALEFAYRQHRADFKARNVRVRVRVGDGMPDVAADERWLGRVFDALLSNACKFSPDGGEVSVSMRRAGQTVIVEITDEGPGVDAALRKVVFEKFKQAGEVLTDKPEGLGLGLPIARLVIEGLGGRIWHETPEAGGSTFAFVIPIEAPPSPPLVSRKRQGEAEGADPDPDGAMRPEVGEATGTDAPSPPRTR